MDDQGAARARGGSIGTMRTVRLILLMLAGAFVGNIFSVGPGSRLDAAENQLTATVFGALIGLTIELLCRPKGPKDKAPWRFGIREMLFATAVAAVGLWIIVFLWNQWD
jgi:hypothetical protein